MNILAISGSVRLESTNSSLLRAVKRVSPDSIKITIYDRLAELPIFSPDLEGSQTPLPVRRFQDEIARCDGILISSPEYVRTVPGGLKNAIDWLVSGEEIISKPIALLHASHRGDEMLGVLRRVLSTVSEHFNEGLFIRFSLMAATASEISKVLDEPGHRTEIEAFLCAFSDFCLGV